ncbi:hypothetical protein JJV70_07470 [Streptomyces sp. JJ66]|uniref:hypothetical protein n=1 Tax=Streptomyces sp. JJ66 TaxID=2803843 RepID=UPI001C58D575|nr:hypothetical protein [Streptomyces sp. JJ66]MBW1601952.1 hypothetical protein [Streptomyces sp. JJ66]
MDSLISVRSWREAERAGEILLSAVAGMASVVTLDLLRRTLENAVHTPGVPVGLREVLEQVRLGMDDDPYDV